MKEKIREEKDKKEEQKGTQRVVVNYAVEVIR